MQKITFFFFLILISLFISCSNGRKKTTHDNWNSYLHDDFNTGVSSDTLVFPLQTEWVREFQNAPEPAWPEPAKQDYYNGKRKLEPLVTYDRAFQPVVHGDNIYVASSANNTVSCYNALDGELEWQFFTGAPNRVAPLWYNNRLYFGSDDGFVYCLNGEDGTIVWKRNYGKSRKLIGNSRIISSTPVRTGIVARGDTIFTATGLLPEEYVAIAACDANTGDTLWTREMKDLAPQGYPVLVDTLWYVPNSRVLPMAFSVKDGNVSHRLKGLGGDNLSFINGRMIYGVDWNGEFNAKRLLEAYVTGYRVTGMNNRMYIASDYSVSAVDIPVFTEKFKKEQQIEKDIKKIVEEINADKMQNVGRLDSMKHALEDVKKEKFLWQVHSSKTYALINTANAVIAGTNDKVTAFDPETGRKQWSEQVKGRPYGMAVSGGRLFVSTSKGYLYCFGNDGKNIVLSEEVENDALKVNASISYDKQLYSLKKYFDRPAGLALISGDFDFSLIAGLNKVTDYRIAGVAGSQRMIAKTREKLNKAGLYGSKTVLFRGTVADMDFSDYMFNVIIVNDKVREDISGKTAAELFRLTAPSGGCIVMKKSNEALYNRLKSDFVNDLNDISGEEFYALQRKKLPGSGEWTSLYANAANTTSTGDRYASDSFRPLWFGRPGPRDMSDRHHRAPSPLYKNGILYITLDVGVLAADAYNGTMLWKKDIPHFRRIKISRDAGNTAVTDDALYAVADNLCYVFDPVSGEEKEVFRTPQIGWWAQDAHWGYLAVDGDLLIGSGRKADAVFNKYSRLDWSEYSRLVTSGYLFAIHRYSGEKRWVYKGGVILNPSICTGDGKVFFVESTAPEAKKDEDGLITFNVLKKKMNIVAVDVNTGQVVWKRPYRYKMIEHVLYGSYSDGIFLLSGSGNVKGSLWYGTYAMDAGTGKELWKQEKEHLGWTNGSHGEQIHRAVIMNGEVYVEPFAYDLKTGVKKRGFKLKREGWGCGTISGAENSLFFRAGNPAACLPDKYNKGKKLNNITRSGCWINMIPAGGLLLIPEASSGCTCNYPLQMSIVYEPLQVTP